MDTRFVTADGGAMDRVAVLAAVLMGLSAATMVVVCVVREIWVGVVFWAVLVGLSTWVGVRSVQRIRRAGTH